MKKIFCFIITLLLTLSLSSCKSSSKNITNDKGEIIGIKRDLKFIPDKDSFFKSKSSNLSTYFFDGGIPYVSVLDYIKAIDYYNKEVIVSDDNNYRFVTNGYNKHIKLDYENNQFIIYDFEIFPVDEKQYLLDSNYNKNLLLTIDEVDEDIMSVINLDEYNLKLEQADDKVLIPFHIINAFFSIDSYYYVYYTGNKYFGYSLADGKTNPNIIKKDEVQLKFSPEYAEYNFNFLNLVFNEFYGLRYYDKNNLGEILNLNKSIYLDENSYLVQTKKFIASLNDNHTSISLSDLITRDDVSSYNSTRAYYRNNLRTRLLSAQTTQRYMNTTSSYMLIDDKTAVIPFYEFSMEKDRNTAQSVALCLDELDSLGVENIIFDVTLNGGGDTFSLAQILGLMTNNDIVLDFINIRNNHYSKEIFKVDSDFDGDFSDDDAYTQFNYYVFSSEYTYSCANDFVHYCKKYNLAKTIGKKTGGGACCIAPVVTPTGALIVMSGLYGIKDSSNDLIEYGVDVDYEIDYENFYKNDYFLAAINSFN